MSLTIAQLLDKGDAYINETVKIYVVAITNIIKYPKNQQLEEMLKVAVIDDTGSMAGTVFEPKLFDLLMCAKTKGHLLKLSGFRLSNS